MPSSDFQVRWSDFKGGDWGSRDASRADRDQWSGENVQLYRSGLLGTRAELTQLTFTGMANYNLDASPRGFAAVGNTLLLVDGARIWALTPPGPGSADWFYADLPNPPLLTNSYVRFVIGNSQLYSLNEGIFRKHSPVPPNTVTNITTPVPFAGVVRWGLWMVAYTDPGNPNPNRIYFNQVDAAGPNYDSWPANNFYDVANSEPVTALRPIGNTLYVGKKQGWWAVTGVLGDLAAIREVTVARGPADERLCAVGPDNRIFHWSAGVSGDFDRVPSFFTGTEVTTDDVRLIQFDEGNGATKSHCDMVAATSNGGRILMLYHPPGLGTTKALMRQGTSWSRHAFPIKIAGVAPREIREGSIMTPGMVYFAQHRANGQSPVVAQWRFDTDKPGDADMTTVSGSARVLGTLQLPAYWEPNGRQVRAKRVIVQFRRWSSGVASTLNRLRLRVDALGAWGGGPVAGTAQEWSDAASASSSTGTDDSVRFDFGEQGFGNGFQVVFEALAGVAIRDVTVEVEIERAR